MKILKIQKSTKLLRVTQRLLKNARKILEDILNNKKNYYKPIIEICEKTIQPYLKNINKIVNIQK